MRQCTSGRSTTNITVPRDYIVIVASPANKKSMVETITRIMKPSSTIIVFIIIFLLPITISQRLGPYCHVCEVLINEVIEKHHGDFSNVSENTLLADMLDECHEHFGGLEALCMLAVEPFIHQLMIELRNGLNSAQICTSGGLC